jgi:predicted GNAT family N-acyltransferase/2-polyprenyl-3-methyl-5-hydroxy-6-metoxy-1,4-benzoquinol methylase
MASDLPDPRDRADVLPVRRTTEVIAELLPLPGRSLLEVGCGEGALLGWLRRRGATAFGLEVELARLERARAALGCEGLAAGVGEALPFAEAVLDAVLYHNSFHHLPLARQTEALVEVARVLRPTGRLLVLEPLAEDEYFELVRPLEDETAIRAAALAALGRAEALGFAPVARDRYVQLVQRRSLEELLAALVAADPARKARLREARSAIEAAYSRLGSPAPEGRVFRQPMLALCLERRAEGPVIAIARTAEERRAALDLRIAVFVREQGVPLEEEVDGLDEQCEHVIARFDRAIVGCLRWRRVGAQGAVKIERVAVRADRRGRGIARAMLAWCLARLDGMGLGPAIVNAQLPVSGLYAGLGFLAEGEIFDEAGIPHRRMVRPAIEPHVDMSGD